SWGVKAVTAKLPVPRLPCASVEEQLTVVVPTGKVLPDAGTQVTGVDPSTSSTAETEKVTTAPAGLVANTLMSAGTVSTGGVESTNATLRFTIPEAHLISGAPAVVPLSQTV